MSCALAAALLCVCPFPVSGATNEAITPAVADPKVGAAPQGQEAPAEKGCSKASIAVMDDIIGSVGDDPFHSNPAFPGGLATDPAGCGTPTRSRKSDPGNPVTPIGRPTSSFTIKSGFR